MTEGRLMRSRVEDLIAEQLAVLHGQWYGRGPSMATAYMLDDVVVVVMEETFTPAERALVQRDEAEGIREIRRRFQQMMSDEFKSIITQATGRTVRIFCSDTDLREGVAVETFILGERLENMESFEHAADGDRSDEPY